MNLHTEYTDATFKEKVTHKIENRPYSIHQTYVTDTDNPVLYQHWHDEIEFFYLEQGELELIIEDRSFYLQAGEAILIPPNLLHMAIKKNTQGCSFFAFVFSAVCFTDAFTSVSYARFVQPLKHNGLLYSFKFSPNITWQQEALLLLKKILSFYNRKDIDVWELELHGLLFQLWNMFHVNYMSSIALSSSYAKLYNRLKPSLDYLHQNFSCDITIHLLASQSNLCIGTFCRYFKELTGLTPFVYLNRYRVRKSCYILMNTSLKITEIAAQSGFNNISYFNRSFLEYIKCTPSEYRKQYLRG